MGLLTRRKTPTEELKSAAIEALVNALDDNKRAPEPGGTKGVRAVAMGAVLYTAGRAVFKRQRFVREQLSSLTQSDRAEDVEDDEETRAYEEPEAEAYEDEEEPEASEEDEDEPEAYEEDEDEPEAYEEDEDEGDDEPERRPTPRFARRKGAQPSLKLPEQRRPRIRMSKD